MDLLKQSGESLAGGRVSYLELQPFDITETGSLTEETDRLWRRGGFAGSLLAISEQQSIRWRNDFIRSYLERDIPQFGLRMPGERLRRLWTMLAHDQGTLLNTAQLARNIGVDTRTAGGHIDLLVDLLLVRRLQPWQANIGKRLVKSPKVYVRDSGLVHALLAIRSQESLLSHPVVGASWEGFVIENLLAIAPEGVHGFFYRTGGGAELDLVLEFPGNRLWAVEAMRGLTPRPKRSFHIACGDLKPDRRFVVYPGNADYPLGEGTELVSLPTLARMLKGSGTADQE